MIRSLVPKIPAEDVRVSLVDLDQGEDMVLDGVDMQVEAMDDVVSRWSTLTSTTGVLLWDISVVPFYQV
jgi:hypothetical protein